MNGAHIALNAHLLSGESSYRAAGIHSYLYNTLINLPPVDPALRYTVLTGGPLSARADWVLRRSRWPTDRPLARIVWEQMVAPLTLTQIGPDLLHGMAFTLPLLWRGASVVTVFDLSFMRYPERLSAARRAYLSVFTRLAVRQARRVIAISESGKREIQAVLAVPAERIDVALPGVSPDFHPCSAAAVASFRQEAGLPERFILFVGTIEPRKNLDTLFRAYAALPQRSRVKLVLVGGVGWQAGDILKTIEALHLKDDIIMPGYVERDTLPLWYSAAELFVYPSVYEGFGLPALEAMACGAPVIVSNATSLPEAVGPDGVLVPPLDQAAWLAAMTRLLDDSEQRRELSERGVRWAARFSWEQAARHTVAAYRSALKAEKVTL